jgi:hypothetical protein
MALVGIVSVPTSQDSEESHENLCGWMGEKRGK